ACAIVVNVTAAADHSRPETHSDCISRQTSSGGGSSNARTPLCVARYQPPNRLANSATWIDRTMARSRRITQNLNAAVRARRLPRTRAAPSPLVGEGWGEGEPGIWSSWLPPPPSLPPKGGGKAGAQAPPT